MERRRVGGHTSLLGALAVLAAGLLESPPITSSTSRVFVNAASTGLLVLVAGATSQVVVPESLPRFVIVLTAFCVFVWILLVGTFFAVRTRRRGGSTRVVAVINPKDAAQLQLDSAKGPWEERFTLVEVITDEQDFGSLTQVFTDGQANTLVLGPVASVNPVVINQAEALHQGGARCAASTTSTTRCSGVCHCPPSTTSPSWAISSRCMARTRR